MRVLTNKANSDIIMALLQLQTKRCKGPNPDLLISSRILYHHTTPSPNQWRIHTSGVR